VDDNFVFVDPQCGDGIVTYFTGRFIVGQNVVTCGYPRIFICAEKVLRSGS